MIEAEWLTATDPTTMLDFLRGKVSDRKLRLFGVTCCREVWPLFTDEGSSRAVELAESFADGRVGNEVLTSACIAAEDAYEAANAAALEDAGPPLGPAFLTEAVTKAAWHVSMPKDATSDGVEIGFGIHSAIDTVVATVEASRQSHGGTVELRARQADALRCIFGNPFRPVTLDPRWRSDTVVALARGIYEERAFDRMPILADALEEVGCDHADILAHCRGDGPHFRGCWVVDLLLGKS